MLISNQTVAAPSIVIEMLFGGQETPIANFNLQPGYCSFEGEQIDVDDVFDLCDMLAGVAADTILGPDEECDGEWNVNIYLFEHREVIEGYMCELLVTKANEVCFYIDGDVDRITGMDPRKGAKIIRKMVEVFKQFVLDHPRKTLYACPHQLDGSGDDRARFFKRLGFIPDMDDDGFSLFYLT